MKFVAINFLLLELLLGPLLTLLLILSDAGAGAGTGAVPVPGGSGSRSAPSPRFATEDTELHRGRREL